MKCPRCEGSCKKNGRIGSAKKQRYKCYECGYQHTPDQQQARPSQERALALYLYLSGQSMRSIAALIGVSPQTILRWIRTFAKACPLPEPDGKPTEVEIDEMWHYIKKNSVNSGSSRRYAVALVELSRGPVARVITPR